MDEQVPAPPQVQEVITSDSKSSSKTIYFAIAIGTVFTLIVSIVVILLAASPTSSKKQTLSFRPTPTQVARPTPTTLLKTTYDNPFDKKSQYENPFTESGSYKNPFSQ